MKRTKVVTALALALAICLGLCYPAYAKNEPQPPARAAKNSIAPLGIQRKLEQIGAANGIEPYSEYWYTNSHAINADLSQYPALAYSLTFSDTTKFPSRDKLPAGYDPEALLEWGKDPGLNVDILHKFGFTGKGATIAYVDQPLGSYERTFGGDLHYKNNADLNDSMHGPAVLSLLAGRDTGTAPEAEIYFYAHASWKTDQTTHAQCLYQIIEQNKSLPEGEKITMVGFSDNIDESEANADAFRAAVAACENAGIMVWFCGEYDPVSFLPYSDRNNYRNLVKQEHYTSGSPELVFVPASGRTTAATMDGASHIYWAEGGVSWTMPYVLGLYAIVNEIDPSLTQDGLRALLVDTAYDNNGMKIVNPVGFVAAALKGVGRGAEADAMLRAVRERSRYLYAVMDTAAMSEADLSAVGAYLAAITDATVLVADASSYSSAKEMYSALRADAAQRGRTVAGVQIFGTPSMVPAFRVQYKVQMPDAVDDGGEFLTDLFYGNFDNDPQRISGGYNVMDHFDQKWDVALTPQWPVARLPLSRGEFSAFFDKYTAFVRETGLERLDLVNFSNPIFGSAVHTDDMSAFLNRMAGDFKLLDTPYRLYGNLEGQYPVTTRVLGGFTKEALSKENDGGIVEFLINSHGQWNNIDQCVFENGEEKRISFLNMDTIGSVLDGNAYYLDCWTCNNGYDMAKNLTTTALNGKCVGMFSATTIISNNGVDCSASLDAMKKSNFYYFYYSYLAALHRKQPRAQAFFSAQAAYAQALLADSANGIRMDGNYQFNLCNLLAYHNFGVIEPNKARPFFQARGYIEQAGQSVPKEPVRPGHVPGSSNLLTDGLPVGDSVKLKWSVTDELQEGSCTAKSLSAQSLDNGYVRFTLTYTAPAGMNICVFDPPNGDLFKLFSQTTESPEGTLVFDVSREHLTAIDGINVNFFRSDNDSLIVYFKVRSIPEPAPVEKPVILDVPETGSADFDTVKVSIDGKVRELPGATIQIKGVGGVTYVYIRDLALLLTDTDARFAVGFDGCVDLVKGQSYAATGAEFAGVFSGSVDYTKPVNATKIGGVETALKGIQFNSPKGGYTYYQLRDLGYNLGFNVRWDGSTGTIAIDTNKQYTGR